MAIQGAGDDKGFVKTFFLQFSNGDDAEERWKPYRENGEDKLFTGNSDSKTVVTRNFQNVIRAKSVKVLPKSYEKNPCLRVEFYGCKTSKCRTRSSLSSQRAPFQSFARHSFSAFRIWEPGTGFDRSSVSFVWKENPELCTIEKFCIS